MSVSSSSSSSSSRIRETIKECLTEAHSSNSHETQHRALSTLASITKLSPQNRNFLAQIKGAIPSLLSLSNSPSSSIQSLSLSILFNLSLNPELKHSLAQPETIHHLHSILLSHTSPQYSKQASSSLICSLAMLDKNKAKFGVMGTIQLLIKSLSSAPPPPHAHHLLSSLAKLVRFHGNCTLAVRSGAVPVLLGIVKNNNNEDLSGTALAILGLLARFNEGLNALRKTELIIASMVDVLKGRCMLSKEGATEILTRLFDESDVCLKDALELPEFLTVINDVSVRGSVRAREKAGLIMKQIATANTELYIDGEESMYSNTWY